MKMKSKKKPTKAGFYILSTIRNMKKGEGFMLVYYENGRYTHWSPKHINDTKKSGPVSSLSDDYWCFWGPINPVEVVA